MGTICASAQSRERSGSSGGIRPGRRGGARRKVASDRQAEQGVREREDPGRCVEEDQAVRPVADERPRVALLPGRPPQVSSPPGVSGQLTPAKASAATTAMAARWRTRNQKFRAQARCVTRPATIATMPRTTKATTTRGRPRPGPPRSSPGHRQVPRPAVCVDSP